MKKRLIQILMLLVATVSVGSFVSCKDTNEDLYNELRTQLVSDNATLEEALRAEIARLEGLIAAIESCPCDEDALKKELTDYIDGKVKDLQDTDESLKGADEDLQKQIDAINEILKGLDALAKADDVYTKVDVDKLIDNLQDQINLIKEQYALKDDLTNLAIKVSSIEYLKDEVADLKKKLDEIKTCEFNCGEIMEKLGNLEGRIIEAEAKAQQALDALKATEDLAKAAQAAADNAQKTADNAQTIANAANAIAQEAKEDAAAAKAVAEACTTLLNTAIQDAAAAKAAAEAAKTMAEENKKAIEVLGKKLEEVETTVTLASKNAEQAIKDAAAAAAKADANKELIDKLTERVTTNEANIENLQKSIENLQSSIKNLENLAEKVGANTEAIEGIKGSIAELNEKVKEVQEMKEKLAALAQQVEDCQKMCAANLAAAKGEILLEIEKVKSELAAKDAEQDETLRLHEKALEQLGTLLGSYTKEDLDEILKRIEDLEAADIELDDRLVTTETTLGELGPRVDELETNVQNLTERISEAEKKLNEEIAPAVNTLISDVAAIQDYLSKQVTSININGTYNPMFGSFSIPANIQSNVLVAYYGRPTHQINFPTTDDAHYSKEGKARVLTEEDWALIKDNLKNAIENKYMFLMNEPENGFANAGKVYMTINPNTVNFEGLKFNLVNTQDKESYVELKNVKKSYETLQFGFSRADNGFYEADAFINRSELQKKFNEEKDNQTLEDKILEISKEIQTKMYDMSENFFHGATNSGDLGTIATKTYEIIREMKLDQNGLKCTYTTEDGTDHSVYSQYGIAATAINPLNLQSFKDVHYYTIPGYEGVEEFMLDKIGGILKDHVSYLFKQANGSWKVQKIVSSLNIDVINFIDATEDYVAKWEGRISGFTWNGNGYTLTIPGTGTVEVKFDKALGNIPAEAVYDEESPDIKKVTIVVYADEAGELQTKLVVPAVGADGVVAAYASIELTNVTVKNVGGVIVITEEDGTTHNVASVSATGAYSITGYETSFVLSNLTGTNGAVSVPVVMTIADDIRDLMGSDLVSTLKAITEDLNGTLAKINEYENVINGWIDQWVDKYLINYLDKINHTTVYFVNSINRRFGPFMTASNDSKGFKILSTAKNSPTVMEQSTLKIYPTTKNMELIVPIARKHVAVTDVIKDEKSVKAGTLDVNILKNANNLDEFNEVIDGTERVIKADGLQKGYTYEIAYSILDFAGNISTQKYYITIK